MMPMMVILGMMLAVSIIPGMRTGLSDAAALVIEPTIPFHDVWFIPTVFIIGTSIMVVNTIIRAFFTDPITQVHNQHRNKQISAQLRDAQSSRDNARAEKMRTLQMHMMPESMKQQGDQMRPVMFTIVFIFANQVLKSEGLIWARILGKVALMFVRNNFLPTFPAYA